MYKIYIVEDEKDLNRLVKSYLEKEGYEVKSFVNGEDALKNMDQTAHLWILDIMLPGEVNGYDLIKKIREQDSLVPVIFTSARDADLDKIIGLELGSDDYIAKPYSPKELVLRVNNIIKRIYTKDMENLIYDDYKINISKRIVLVKEKEIKLTTLEFDLLLMLLKNKATTFSRSQILDKVWTDDYFGNERAVDDLVRRLRKKMPLLKIETIYGYGYRLL